MTLKERAQRDIKNITTNDNEWAQEITMYAPTGEVVTVKGLHTKHHLGVDPELKTWINTKNAHISISEEVLTAVGYPVRNAEGEVHLEGHFCRVADSTGELKAYTIAQWFPNETIGLITCILGDYNG